jgi:hypothetical protein
MAEFKVSPFKQKSFIKYNIISYRPTTGIIEASLNDTIRIVIETSDADKDRNISSDPFLDTSIYSTPTSALLVPPGPPASRTTYTYVVNAPGVEWLYILYNDDIVLRYKLVVKNRSATMASSN